MQQMSHIAAVNYSCSNYGKKYFNQINFYLKVPCVRASCCVSEAPAPPFPNMHWNPELLHTPPGGAVCEDS